MNGESLIEQKIAQAQADKQVAAEANGTPLPGALANSFTPCQNIIVKAEGKEFIVRPFYEIDFEVLQMCEHPLARMALGGEKYGEQVKDLRGEPAWIACWLLTTDVDTVDTVAEDGVKAVRKAARKVFGRMQLGGVLSVSKAVLEQFSLYFSTVVGLEEGGDKEGESPKKA